MGQLQRRCSTLLVLSGRRNDYDGAPGVVKAVRTGRAKEQLGGNVPPPPADNQ
jgi:hypothetical protein